MSGRSLLRSVRPLPSLRRSTLPKALPQLAWANRAYPVAAFATSSRPTGPGGLEPEDIIEVVPVERPNEETEAKRARLLYQSRKRGILESDLLLSKFAKLHLPTLTRAELDEYDALLDEQDWDIYYWASEAEGTLPCPEKWANTATMAKLREIAANKDREILRMPDL